MTADFHRGVTKPKEETAGQSCDSCPDVPMRGQYQSEFDGSPDKTAVSQYATTSVLARFGSRNLPTLLTFACLSLCAFVGTLGSILQHDYLH